MSICDYLKGRQVGFDRLLHRPASSATQFAQSVHVPGRMVGKTVLVRAGDAFLVAVLPATHRIDLPALAAACRAPVEIASMDDVERVFRDCEPGALPPFGRVYGLPTWVNRVLVESRDIVFEANTRSEGVRMSYRDYEAIEAPRTAAFAVRIAPEGRKRRTA